MTGEKCQYCWRPVHVDGHNDGCPLLSGTEEALAVWEKGYDYGWSDEWIHWYERRYYTATFLLGYQVGKGAINQLVDEAAQRNCSFHTGEH